MLCSVCNSKYNLELEFKNQGVNAKVFIQRIESLNYFAIENLWAYYALDAMKQLVIVVVGTTNLQFCNVVSLKTLSYVDSMVKAYGTKDWALILGYSWIHIHQEVELDFRVQNTLCNSNKPYS